MQRTAFVLCVCVCVCGGGGGGGGGGGDSELCFKKESKQISVCLCVHVTHGS